MSADAPGPHETRNSQRENRGQTVQAGSIGGGVHFHSAPDRAPVPRQVEPPTPYFVNHEECQSWTRGHMDPDAPPKVVVYGGPRGIGKTELLRMISYTTGDYFTGGQLTFRYARGRQEDGAAALAQFLQVLGVHRSALPEDPGLWPGAYRTHTHDRRLLVVVEGAWEPAQVRALVPSGRGSLVLVSNDGADLRELKWADHARTTDLRPLDRAASLVLVERLVAHPLAEEDPGALERLLEVCGGLPLALVLVSGQLDAGGPGSAAALVARVDGARRMLRAIGDDQGNLDVFFRTAYEGLSPRAAALYRALGTWPGSRFDRRIAARVGDAGALRELVTARLVKEDGDGLGFEHDLLRVHAGELAEEEPERGRRERLRLMLDAYLASLGFAERLVRGERLRVVDLDRLLEGEEDPFGGDAELARGWLSRERPTLVAVVLGCADAGLHEHTWRFAELATALYLEERYLHDWEATGTAGADAARMVGNAAAEARLGALVSRPLRDLHKEDLARERILRAVELVEDVEDELLRGSVWEFYGRFLEKDDPAGAIEAYDRSVRHNRASGSPHAVRGTALAILFRGAARLAARRPEEAVADLEDAVGRLLALPEGPDDRMAARARTALGRAYHAAGRDREAVAALNLAVEGFSALTAHLGYYEAEAHEALAEVLDGLGAAGDARRHRAEALRLFREVGSPRAQAVEERASGERDRAREPAGPGD
ncbi:hypothetical protein [Nocardiopsis tropica]|uniref:Uncharacterized protein n=1 Tax=Nocardiopsis tropica TaxID=109330 RepID=A0ABV1ZWF1_9ACTN